MTTIFWASDSTVKQNPISTYPRTGIGQVFHRYVKNLQVQIENHAENGRSTKSFIDEGRLAAIEERIKENDFLFIQFGHNDELVEEPTRYTDPETTFTNNLERFVAVARSKGAIPVFITPVTRCDRHNPDARYRHDEWVASYRNTAKKLGVAPVDLTQMSEELVDRMGDTARTSLFMHIPAGIYPAYPDGLSDDTHLQHRGAVVFAGLIAKGLFELGGIYADLLFDGYAQWLQMSECCCHSKQ